MKISVILPCYNAQDTIGVQLDALTRQKWKSPWEVIVANNMSTDASMQIVRRYINRLPNLKIIDADQSQGAAYALNAAVEAAKGEALVFCDADDMAGEGWLYSMGKALLKFDFVACGMETELLNSHLPKNHGFGNPQKFKLQKIWYPPYLSHAGGGTIGIRRKLHEAVGGFDETFHYLQDTDYCFRVQIQTQTKLRFVDNTVMHVRYRDSLLGTYLQSKNYAKFNVFLSEKYKSFAPAMQGLWRTYISDWKSLAKLVLGGNYSRKKYIIWWKFGRQVGRFVGCLKFNVPPV
jgi:glycosyltransferase involved in cell wall biosynthesis